MMLKLIFTVLFVYMAFGVFLFFFQKAMIYYPQSQDFDSCSNFEDAQKVEYKNTRMLYRNGSEKIIVFYHGNAGSVCDRAYMKELMGDASYLFVEYAGYSNDGRKPSKKLILQDVENVVDFLKDKKYKEIIVIGESIGSGPTSYQTTLMKVDKMVLISPLSSTYDIAKITYFMYPLKLLMTENYDNMEWLREYDGDAMIIHGVQDEIVPLKHARKLFEGLSCRKEFVEVEGKHNNVYNDERLEESIKRFISEED